MKKLLAVLAAVVTLAAIGVTAAVSSGDGRAVVKFDTMAPVVQPYTGTANPIRGVNGGGVPWKLGSAQGRLRADGRLDIEVQGLVLVSTDPVPATMTGNAEIDAKVVLPSPCFAPIVFVTSGGGNWFAVTGR